MNGRHNLRQPVEADDELPRGRAAGYGSYGGQRADQFPERSNVTRLLCAGVHLDPRFCHEVIDELVRQGHRRTAPAYGYDCVSILAHALHARDRRRIRNLAMLAGVVALVLSVDDAEGLGLQWFLLSIWWIWAVLVIERVMTVHLLISRLKRTRGSTHDTRLPWHPTLDRLARKVTVEQSQAPVFYSGYVPFVGAGTLSRSWSFSVVLRAANPAARPGRFTSDELVDHVCHQVIEQLRNQVGPAERINGLTAAPRLYSTLLRPSGFDTSTIVPNNSTNPAAPVEEYGSARRYACVNISSWDGELVTSIFVGFDIRGDTLHTELHSYVLLPINAEYHEVDRLPEELSVADVLVIAAESPLKAVRDFFRSTLQKTREFAPAGSQRSRRPPLIVIIGFTLAFLPTILFSLFFLAGFNQERVGLFVLGFLALWIGPAVARPLRSHLARRMAEKEADRRRTRSELAGSSGRTVVDYGARTSIRELAASEGPHHFFQSTDQDKYTKIIERRITDFIMDFLRTRNVDVSEFETRQQVVLNYGIMQTGDGQIINSGAMAVGTSTATTTTAGNSTVPANG